MAYSGAVSMCSGKMLYPNAGSISTYIIIGLSLVVLLGIVLNRRDKRTWIALSIASAGILLLCISQFLLFSEVLYYVAVGLIFFGIWFNGSFTYFYQKYFNVKRTFGVILKTRL